MAGYYRLIKIVEIMAALRQRNFGISDQLKELVFQGYV